MVHVNKKPAIPAKYLKGKVLREGGSLYESIKVNGRGSNTSYRWAKLPTQDSIPEDDEASISGDFVGRTLYMILDHMDKHPEYEPTWLDYQSFYDHRARYSDMWNRFLDLSHRP